jgi:hypothetical protein
MRLIVPRTLILVLYGVLVLVTIFVAGCGEKVTETIREVPVDPGGSDELPEAVVTENRPLNPDHSLVLPCPWGVVDDVYNNEYLVGNFGPDVIPSIDEPRWETVGNTVLALLDNEPVAVVERDGEVRAFPTRIMLHHEIVNMCWSTSEGDDYTYISYCPLVDGYMHYDDPRVCTAKHKYGVSGALFNGNLVTFDRKTVDRPPLQLFVQLYAGGVLGSCGDADPMATTMNYGLYRRLYPQGKVLSMDTGDQPDPAAGDGGYNLFDHPYDFYWRAEDIWFPLEREDPRLPKMEHVLGVIGATENRAYEVRGQNYALNDTLAGLPIAVFNDHSFGSTLAYEAVHDGQALTFTLVGREKNGILVFKDAQTGTFWSYEGIAVDGPLAGARLPRLMAFRVFWFAWYALYPDAELRMLPSG